MQLLVEHAPGLFALFAFLFGATVGSFLNVVIARVPAGESIVRPGSRCPRCKTPIAWYDNLPVASWLILRARCRSCGLPISARYPMVELLMGLLSLALFRRFGPTAPFLGYFAFTAMLLALAYIDLDTWLLPHEITWPLLGLGLLSPLWNPQLGFAPSAIGAAAGFALFAAIALFGEKVLKRETMGWGDVWLLGAIGAWLGWTALFPVVLLSALQGAAVGLILIAAGKSEGGAATPELPAVPESPATSEPPAATLEPPATSESPATTLEPPAIPEPPASIPDAPESSLDDDWVPPRHAVPYGPFLALAALEQLLIGDAIWAAYEGLLRRLWS